MANLFENVPQSLEKELVEVLAKHQSVRIERIVSTGQTSAKDFWYDQDEHEWVVLLSGEAKLLLLEPDDTKTQGAATLQHMTPGDHILIRPHQKHRVEWTTPEEPTVWLAIFFRD